MRQSRRVLAVSKVLIASTISNLPNFGTDVRHDKKDIAMPDLEDLAILLLVHI